MNSPSHGWFSAGAMASVPASGVAVVTGGGTTKSTLFASAALHAERRRRDDDARANRCALPEAYDIACCVGRAREIVHARVAADNRSARRERRKDRGKAEPIEDVSRGLEPPNVPFFASAAMSATSRTCFIEAFRHGVNHRATDFLQREQRKEPTQDRKQHQKNAVERLDAALTLRRLHQTRTESGRPPRTANA